MGGVLSGTVRFATAFLGAQDCRKYDWDLAENEWDLQPDYHSPGGGHLRGEKERPGWVGQQM